MLSQEREEMMAKLLTHFPKSTDGDVELLWGQVKGLRLCEAVKAIETHRMECGKTAYRADLRRIGQLAAGYRDSRRRAASQQQKAVDFFRQGDRAGVYRGIADATVILMHYSECFASLMEEVCDTFGQQMARGFIFAHAKAAFREIGCDPDFADTEARGIVGLKKGESITGRLFKMPPIDPSPRTPEAMAYQSELAAG